MSKLLIGEAALHTYSLTLRFACPSRLAQILTLWGLQMGERHEGEWEILTIPPSHEPSINTRKGRKVGDILCHRLGIPRTGSVACLENNWFLINQILTIVCRGTELVTLKDKSTPCWDAPKGYRGTGCVREQSTWHPQLKAVATDLATASLKQPLALGNCPVVASVTRSRCTAHGWVAGLAQRDSTA